MTEERRSDHSSDLRRIFDQIAALTKIVSDGQAMHSKDISDLRADFRVHVAEDQAMMAAVKQHTVNWEEFERQKTRGMLYIILGFLASGGMGGTVAHLARRFLE